MLVKFVPSKVRMIGTKVECSDQSYFVLNKSKLCSYHSNFVPIILTLFLTTCKNVPDMTMVEEDLSDIAGQTVYFYLHLSCFFQLVDI